MNMKWIMTVSASASLLASALLLAGCGASGNRTNIEIIQDMMENKAHKAQGHLISDREKSSMREPPEHTVPRGFAVYKYPTDPIAAEANLHNPFAGDESMAMLERGRRYFEINCALCHGSAGHGDGQIAAKMLLKPPPLVSDKVKAFKDGRIFHIITMGQGVMGKYSTQLTDPNDRWAVVNYVRYLQKHDQAQGGK